MIFDKRCQRQIFVDGMSSLDTKQNKIVFLFCFLKQLNREENKTKNKTNEQKPKRKNKKNTKQNKAFKAFVEAGGESLDMLAVYDALQSHLKGEGKESWGWPVFPEEFKDYHNPAVAKFKRANEHEVKFYLFLQWIAAQQLEQASNKASDAGMTIGLYRDLAVGVSEGSAEIWGNKDLYCTDASVGAPPDILGPLGQNWGLPPMDPRKLYEQGYQPIIDLFASNMASSGSLRIDHVMALLRLWWVVKGDDAKEGGYVYYPVDDLLGILALESHRNQSLVIGEDLGTVPEEIRSKLAENGVPLESLPHYASEAFVNYLLAAPNKQATEYRFQVFNIMASKMFDDVFFSKQKPSQNK